MREGFPHELGGDALRRGGRRLIMSGWTGRSAGPDRVAEDGRPAAKGRRRKAREWCYRRRSSPVAGSRRVQQRHS
jgi:hypothetical protein